MKDISSELLPHTSLGVDAGVEIGLCVMASARGRRSN